MEKKRQIQKELFEEFLEPEKRRHSKGLFLPKPKRTASLSYEHLIFIAIAFIIAGVVSFSLGVEKGKTVAAKNAPLPLEEAGERPPVLTAEAVEAETEPVQPPEEVALRVPQPVDQTTGVDKVSVLYTIQVASYLKEATAEWEANQLKKKGFESFVRSSDKYYIVCVGEFADKKAANLERKKLSAIYTDCLVRRK